MRPLRWLAACLLAASCATPSAQQPPPATAAAAPGAPDAEQPPTPGEKAVEAYFAPVVAACGRGDAPACARLARRLGYVTNDRERHNVAQALAKGCAAHVPVACAGQAVTLAHAGTAPEVTRGLEQLRATCAADEPFACGQLAEIEIKGELGVTGKQEDGVRRAKDACDKHGGWPCMSAAASLDPSTEQAQMLALVQRACDGGDSSACYLLGQGYAEGQMGLAPDPKRATALYQRGCDGDFADSCTNLAWQYLRGTGAPKDEAQGRTLLVRACTLGDAAGCDELARRDGKPRPYCELWGAQACYDVAVQVSKERGETAEAAEDMIWAGDRACRRGHDGACNVMRHVAKDFVRWCQAGERIRDTCTFAGLVHLLMAGDKNGTDNDRRRATTQARDELARACGAGAAPACEAGKRLGP